MACPQPEMPRQIHSSKAKIRDIVHFFLGARETVRHSDAFCIDFLFSQGNIIALGFVLKRGLVASIWQL